MKMHWLLPVKQYLLKKVDLLATYINDFFGLDNRASNSEQIYVSAEETRMNT